MSSNLGDVPVEDLIDELEYRKYVVIDSESFNDVVEQIKQWKQH